MTTEAPTYSRDLRAESEEHGGDGRGEAEVREISHQNSVSKDRFRIVKEYQSESEGTISDQRPIDTNDIKKDKANSKKLNQV